MSPTTSRRTAPSRRTARTDIGTAVLHWALLVVLVTPMATGLAIAADQPNRGWLNMIAAVLPDGDVWSMHIASGFGLAALGLAYATYMRHARLTRRIRLDRARLNGLVHGGPARWSALNIIVVWLALALLLTQVVTGFALYLGYGGMTVAIHYWAAMALLAFPVAHVGVHYATGRTGQVLRIFRPESLRASGERPDLAALVKAHFENRDAKEQTKIRTTRLQAHPLSIAGAVAFVAATLASTLDFTVRDRLTIERVARADIPKIDGDLADPIWRRATVTAINTNQGSNFGGAGTTRVTVRAVHDGESAYFALTWTDPTRSLKHLPLVKKPDGWHLVHARYDIEDENLFYEDKLAVMLAQSAHMPAAGTVHMGAKPLANQPAAYSGRGLHYTTDGSVVDVWHWKAVRGGLLGYMDDNYFGPPIDAKPDEVAGKSRYKAGYATDTGNAFYANNFDHEPAGGYTRPVKPKRLPKDLAKTVAAMGHQDLDPERGEPDGARWWMTEDESVAYAPELDARIPIGTVIPGVLIKGEYTGDRAHVRCAAKWAAGQWTLEIVRRLNTGSRTDVAIESGVAMWVAAFDHAQTRHTRHLRPVILEVKE